MTATGTALPRIPRAVAVPLAIGCWSNALAFAPPAVRRSIEQSKPFRVMVGTSFAVTAASWVAVASIAVRRWTRKR